MNESVKKAYENMVKSMPLEEAGKILNSALDIGLKVLKEREAGNETPMAEAERIIYGDREKTYGDPSKNLARIAEMWTAYLQKNFRNGLASVLIMKFDKDISDQILREITEDFSLNLSVTDVCRMMQHLKQSRDENLPKKDNVVDDIGYAGLVHRCRTPVYERSIPQGVNGESVGVRAEVEHKVVKHRKTRKSKTVKRKARK